MKYEAIDESIDLQPFNSDNLINPMQYLKQNLLCEICKLVLFEPVACKRCEGRFHKQCVDKYLSVTG